MRAANIRDSASIVKYFAFLEEKLNEKDHGLNEYNAAKILAEYRKGNKNYIGPSFDTISSTGANGAIIHYHAT
jgi:Xaa-Pro aminopeptidase